MAVCNVIPNLYFFVFTLIVLNTVIGALEQRKKGYVGINEDHDSLLDDEIVDISISKSRVKRNNDDDLHIAVTLGNKSVIEVILQLTSGILANKDTPVWDAEGTFDVTTGRNTVEYTRNNKALSMVGPVSFYQNWTYRAAVTLFHDYEVMEGIVRQFEFKQNATKSESARNKFSQGQQVIPNAKPSSAPNKGIASPDMLRSNGKPNIVYPELLVILDQNYARNGTPEALMKTLAYWNNVDMLFSILKSPKIKLNIAGIIVPTNYFAAPWIQKADPFGNNGFIDIDVALEAFGDYFLNDEVQFPNDGYDFVINLISMELHNSKGQNDITGVSYLDANCDKRKYRVGIINYKSDNASTTGARELGRLLSAPYDDETEKCKNDETIMAKPSKSKPASFTWSQCSNDAFAYYFSQQKSMCLDNCPKTVHSCEENIEPTPSKNGSTPAVNNTTSGSNSANKQTAKASTSDASSLHKKNVGDMKSVLFYSLIISSYLCKMSIFTAP